MLKSELKKVLAGNSGEREALKFLARHPELVRWAFCKVGGHSTYVLKEFPFGNRFRADLVVATSYSGAWEVHFVELEPVGDPVITKEGVPSKRFNKALSQIGDWDAYIEKNPVLVREDLSHRCIKSDLLKFFNDGLDPTNYAGNKLRDPETCIWFHYHIVIGRRENVGKEKRDKINQNRKRTAVNIVTYDNFIDVAENLENTTKRAKKVLSTVRK